MTDETLNKYDEVTNATFINIFSKTKNCETIKIKDFDIGNKNDMFFIRVAGLVGGVYGKALEVYGINLIDYLILKAKIGKAALVKRTNDPINAISAFGILDFEKQTFGDEIFAEIYDTYFTKKGRKQLEN